MSLKDRIRSNPKLKKLTLWLTTSQMGVRPRWWVKYFVNPFYHKRGRGTIIFRSVRLDVMPYNFFGIGDKSTIETRSIVNNGMGAVKIGSGVFLGAGNVVIGPVIIE